ncbi:MAG TPA: nitronate monooxygenase [Gaiellaceae bacterium]|nr:nitronate monooxygenase [Gaiellaceae bacterium]
MPRTPLCDLLRIEHPILSVGFARGASPELVAAVSNAGGLGVIGSSAQPLEALPDVIARTRALTERPFGANLILDDQGDEERAAGIRARYELLVEERVPLLVFFMGDPSPLVEEAHAGGTKVAIQVGSPAEARRAADAGVDVVIAQGREAGGHIAATASLFVNLPTIVDAVAPLPVLASGGIADGRGLAAALVLGATGVSLGTRFVASEEAFAREEYKRRIVAATAEETFYSDDLFDVWWPGVPHRALKARTYAEWDAAGRPPPGERPHEGEPIGALESAVFGRVEVPRYASFMLTPLFDGDVELGPMWAGESAALVHEILPAGEIVRRIAAEADRVLAGVAAYATR